jgi:peptidoglycan/xylan/chitin deacetylase (PgdA/CDA1 family)
MYHRIAKTETDPWQLAVNQENFEQQLKVLKKKYNIISVCELTEQLINNKIIADSVCLTFDDAYTDNYLYAKPLLEKHDCPATFFVPTLYIGQNKLFWWDELKNILLDSIELPGSVHLFIGQNPFEFQLGDRILSDELREKHAAWVWPKEPPTQRCALYLKLWELLQPLTINEIESKIDELRAWSKYTLHANKEDFPMNNRQLEEIFSHPLFDLGIHTLTHPALSFHTKEMQQHEIVACKYDLEERSGSKVNLLAYPYGNYNATTLTIIKEENITAAFTTQEETITIESDHYRLGRFQVLNQNGKQFEKQMRTWLQSS